MIAIIDYGMGNLRSVQKAVEKVGGKTLITEEPADLAGADKIVLPGVGAIQPAMAKLAQLRFIPEIKAAIRAKKPFLGICLGLQLLFDTSREGGNLKGLGIIRGSVERFGNDQKVPHMGWNQLKIKNKSSALFKNIDEGANVYFCHSYFVKPFESSIVAATTVYGAEFVSAIAKDNVYGVQFHPEKSQSVGLAILKNFVEL